MKIIQYLPYSYHIHNGGLEKIAQTISDGLNTDDNIQLTNIASNITRNNVTVNTKHSKYTDTIFIPSFDLVYNFPIPKFWIREFWQQFSVIKIQRPDTIITHTRFFVQSLVGGLIAKRIGCKRVHIEHGSGFVIGYPWYIKTCAWLFDWTIGLWIFRQCDQIVTISQMHKDFISKFTKKEPTVIYNPIDYQPKAKIKNTIPHIGFIGRLVPLKGVDILIRALKALENKQRICTIIGTGSEDERLKQLTKNLSLSDRIIFVGMDDRENWLGKFDIFVNPSHQEGLPTTVVEALMQKCIVVATDVGGTKEISNKNDLILVESKNIEELKKGIEKGFSILNISGSSYEKIIEKFGVKNAIRKYKSLL